MMEKNEVKNYIKDSHYKEQNILNDKFSNYASFCTPLNLFSKVGKMQLSPLERGRKGCVELNFKLYSAKWNTRSDSILKSTFGTNKDLFSFCRILQLILLASIVCLVISSPSLAQQNNSASIKGRITSSENGQPLEFTNVFLANTTIGAMSGKNGEFVINNIPPGTYDIFFSFVGYEMQKEHILINSREMLTYNISLKPKPLVLSQVEVVGTIPTEWKNNLEIFTNLFIGETNNSKMTKILNPEVIHFSESKNPDILRVTADSVLKIENKSLGYMMYVVLETFSYNKSNTSIKYTSYSRFQELTSNSKEEQEQWEKNRRITYLNSPRYFFYQLVHRELKNNFLLYSGAFDELRYRNGIPVKERDLYITTDQDSVIYTFNFNENLKVVKRPGSETSILTFYKPRTEIDRYGNFSKPYFTVEFNGYWSKQGLADALPKNYFYTGN